MTNNPLIEELSNWLEIEIDKAVKHTQTSTNEVEKNVYRSQAMGLIEVRNTLDTLKIKYHYES